jgi:hypothetical protein
MPDHYLSNIFNAGQILATLLSAIPNSDVNNGVLGTSHWVLDDVRVLNPIESKQAK